MYFLLLIIFIIIVIFLLLSFIYITNKLFYLNIDDKTTCWYTRFGCCKDKITPKLDQNGTNCKWP